MSSRLDSAVPAAPGPGSGHPRPISSPSQVRIVPGPGSPRLDSAAVIVSWQAELVALNASRSSGHLGHKWPRRLTLITARHVKARFGGGDGGGRWRSGGVREMTEEDTKSQRAAVDPDDVLLNQSTPVFVSLYPGPAHFIFFFFFIPSQSSGMRSELPNQRMGRGGVGGWGNQHVNSNNKRSRSKHLPAPEGPPGRQNLPTHKQRCSDMASNNEERRAPVDLSQGCSRCACFRFSSSSPFHKHRLSAERVVLSYRITRRWFETWIMQRHQEKHVFSAMFLICM